MGIADEVVRAHDLTLADVVPVWESTSAKFVAQLRSVEPSRGGARVPGLKWTVAETAAHMLSVLGRGLDDFRRSETREGLAELNDLCIGEIEERDLTALADRIDAVRSKTATILRATTEEDAASAAFPLHAGLRANIPTALSYALFDFLGHGYDISLAGGDTWSWDPVETGITMRAVLPALRPWVNEDVLRGPRREARLAFIPDVALELRTGDGTWRVEPAAEEAPEVDPVELFLAVAGRVPPKDPNVARVADWFAPI